MYIKIHFNSICMKLEISLLLPKILTYCIIHNTTRLKLKKKKAKKIITATK